MSIYEIEVPTINGGSTTLEEFKGQLLLIVNTASGSSSLCFIEKRDNWTFRRKG